MADHPNITGAEIKARPVAWAVRIGALTGLVFFLGLFIYALATSGGFSVMGVKNEALARMVRERYLGILFLYQLKAAFAYALVGAGLGALFGRVLYERDRERPQGTYVFAAGVAAALAAVHLYMFSRGVILQPQLYTERLYDAGGAGRGFQVFLTDRLGPAKLKAAGLLLSGAGMGWIVWPRLRRGIFSRPWALRPGIPAAVGAGAVVTLSVFWLSFSHGPLLPAAGGPAGTSRPNVVIIGVDSLRYDRLACHGSALEIAPAMDALCREGLDFQRAYVSLPRTFPSLVTLLTGLYPDRHGVRHMFPRAEDRDRPLPGLPRALGEAGYRTRAISDFSGDVLTRVDLGFDRVLAPTFNLPMLLSMRGLEIHSALLPYINNRIGRMAFPELREFVQASDPAVLGREARAAIHEMKGGPFFLTVFFSTPHFPYAAPYPDYARFTDPDYSGPYKYHKPNLITMDEALSEQDKAQIRGLYDGAVAGVDRQVGLIMDVLRREGLLDNTIVVLTADHGEYLYESDRGMGHGEHLRGDRVLRVPLIIRDPGADRTPARIDSVVRSVDLVPTLLDRLGIADAVPRDGISLMPLVRGERSDLGLSAFAETGIWFVDSGRQFFQHQRLDYPDVVSLMEVDPARGDEIVLKEAYRDLVEAAKHRMILRGGYKLIAIPTRRGVSYELYDQAADPENERPLDPAEYSGVFVSLKKDLWAWMGRDPRRVVRDGFLLADPEMFPR